MSTWRPRIEQDQNGAFWMVIPWSPGGAYDPMRPDAMRVELSPEGLTGLAQDIGAHLVRLKQDPEQMKKVGASFVSGVIDLFTKGK